MKKYIIFIILLLLSGCVSLQQSKTFNVMPTFCHDGECFSIEKRSNLLVFNANLPEGEHKIETVITCIFSGNDETEKDINTQLENNKYEYRRVHNDIVTWEINDLLVQYNQKTQKIIHFVDKAGTLTPAQINSLKGSFKKKLGLDLPPYASSGEIFHADFNLNLAKNYNIKMNADYYIHGETYYNNKKYPLVEIKGEGKMRMDGSSIPVIYSGYFIIDPTMNITVKSVSDATLKMDGTSHTMRIISTSKIVQ